MFVYNISQTYLHILVDRFSHTWSILLFCNMLELGMYLSKCRAHLKGPPGSSNPLLSHCLYVSEIYLSKQLTMTTQWQAIDMKAKSLCYFLDESIWSIWQEAPSSHIASMGWIAGSHGLVYTKSIGKVKHEKIFLGWIDSYWAKMPSSNLSYFHQLKQIESIREKEVEQTFVIGVSGWSNIPHSATTPQSAEINKTYNLREAA